MTTAKKPKARRCSAYPCRLAAVAKVRIPDDSRPKGRGWYPQWYCPDHMVDAIQNRGAVVVFADYEAPDEATRARWAEAVDWVESLRHTEGA